MNSTKLKVNDNVCQYCGAKKDKHFKFYCYNCLNDYE